jgi:tRNA-modifying protein YgfZ
VSFHKGCYTGQEIIARMESRGKLAKMLVRIEIAASVPIGTPLLDSTGNRVGQITSVGQTPQSIIGLGVVKTAQAISGEAISGEMLKAVPESAIPVEATIQAIAGSYKLKNS